MIIIQDIENGTQYKGENGIVLYYGNGGIIRILLLRESSYVVEVTDAKKSRQELQFTPAEYVPYILKDKGVPGVMREMAFQALDKKGFTFINETPDVWTRV